LKFTDLFRGIPEDSPLFLVLLFEIVEDFSTLDLVTYCAEEAFLVIEWHHIQHLRDTCNAPAKRSVVLLTFAAFAVLFQSSEGYLSKFVDLLLQEEEICLCEQLTSFALLLTFHPEFFWRRELNRCLSYRRGFGFR